MAEVEIKQSKDRHKAKHQNIHIDLTPMVDLAFLMIAFFMLTTALQQKGGVNLDMPESKGPPAAIAECQVIHVLADSLGQFYYWEGIECQNVKPFFAEDSSAFKKLILNKRITMQNCLNTKNEKRNLICLIKLLPKTPYQSMLTLLDAMAQYKVETYSIQDYSKEEIVAISHLNKKQLAIKNH